MLMLELRDGSASRMELADGRLVRRGAMTYLYVG